MTTTRLAAVLLAVLFFTACQKEISDFGEPEVVPGPTACQLTRMVQGATGTPADTVFHISYDNNKRIVKLVDSTHQDTMTAIFHSSGKLARIDHDWGYFKLFDYTPENRLSAVVSPFSAAEYEYLTGDTLPIRVNLYEWDDQAQDFLPLAYDTLYYDGDGQLVRLMEYDPAGVPVMEIQLTYSALQNTFGALGLFNYENYLGMGDIFPLSIYYALDGRYMLNTYRETMIATNEQFSVDVNYTTDPGQKITGTRAILKQLNNGATVATATATRKYFYTCP
ncbi:MAG: hypothetical protein P0Y53_22275 [Candidatus Pseudobacter hemicellulosilyticus]|uniref:DUF4595 domain-containing protein n=1 Tax=Candidatus Pseudobacter hemicellulosilyticus TaxID=3121375 RepID=A0AAJ6BHI9_9BACT|nr:MAG: hypothetical protein P0Y53_22275 [Pseudobacter sp.]